MLLVCVRDRQLVVCGLGASTFCRGCVVMGREGRSVWTCMTAYPLWLPVRWYPACVYLQLTLLRTGLPVGLLSPVVVYWCVGVVAACCCVEHVVLLWLCSVSVVLCGATVEVRS